jgi:hypothetical protein
MDKVKKTGVDVGKVFTLNLDGNKDTSWITEELIDAHVQHMNLQGVEYLQRKLKLNIEAQIESSTIDKSAKHLVKGNQ